jgi:hypothetical protein
MGVSRRDLMHIIDFLLILSKHSILGAAICGLSADGIASRAEPFQPGLVQVGLLGASAAQRAWGLRSSPQTHSSRTKFHPAQNLRQWDDRWSENASLHADWANCHSSRCARIARNASSATTTRWRRDIQRSHRRSESLQD